MLSYRGHFLFTNVSQMCLNNVQLFRSFRLRSFRLRSMSESNERASSVVLVKFTVVERSRNTVHSITIKSVKIKKP